MATTILKLIGVTDARSLGNLSPAYDVVQKMADTYQHLKLGQKRWKVVIQRAAIIIKELRDNPSRISAPGIQELQRKLEEVQEILERFSDMPFVKALLRHEDVNEGIKQANSLLDECQRLLQIDLSRLMQSQRNAEVSDQDALRALLKVIVGNYEEIRRRFNIENPEEEDQAMAALEREVKNAKITPDGVPLELQIMQTSLDCIRTTTGRRAPKQNKWLITKFDLDFCGTIGGGGFSTVSKAQYKGTMVAVKELKEIENMNMREALEREIEIWSELRHDHIVPFYGASTLTSAPYIVSRYMQNGNLAQYLVRNQDADRTKLVLEVSLGMYYLHEKSVVHGDLKGYNVLVDDSGKACITDFGLSKVSSGKPGDRTGTVAGTLRYLAPEALKGDPLSFETDVYAFGMTIYEVFTGEGPFIRESDESVWKGRVELSRPIMTQAYERGFNDMLWQLLSECISREPSTRPRFKGIQEQLSSIKKAELSAQSFVADPMLGNKNDTDWALDSPTQISQALPPMPLDQPSSASRRTVPPPPTTTSAPIFPGSFSSHTVHPNPDDHDRHSLHHSNTVYSSPTLVNSSRSTIHPIRKAETLPPMEQLSISEYSKPRPPTWTPILPMCIVITHKYFGARFGVSSREPGVHLEETNAIRWHPITAKKGTLLYNEPNRFWFKSGAGTEQNLWELSGNDVTLRTGSTIGVCHFEDPQTAQRWFTLQLNHTRNGTVDGLAAIGNWFYTERSWRRLVLGKVQQASLVGGAPKIVPNEHSWSDVGLPKRCVLASHAGHDNCVVCITNAGTQTMRLTCKLEARRIVFETYHAERGVIVRATEETYPTEEYAAMTFRALRTTIERASGR